MVSSYSSAFVNFIEHPPWVIGSLEFNEHPEPLSISGVRESNRYFFKKLDEESCSKRRGEIFHEYMSVKFALHQWEFYQASARKSLRNSYVRFLTGWGMDSNSMAGAVLKGWVHSRFGLMPTYHRELLPAGMESEGLAYSIDRMKGYARTNAINAQLDLLFEFCQYELKRRFEGQSHKVLYRGTHDAEEYELIKHESKRERIVSLNNLSSFTADREKAWEFGSTVWQANIPLVKVVFFSGLLPDSLLRGEDEYLVVGGDYRVKELLF